MIFSPLFGLFSDIFSIYQALFLEGIIICFLGFYLVFSYKILDKKNIYN